MYAIFYKYHSKQRQTFSNPLLTFFYYTTKHGELIVRIRKNFFKKRNLLHFGRCSIIQSSRAARQAGRKPRVLAAKKSTLKKGRGQSLLYEPCLRGGATIARNGTLQGLRKSLAKGLSYTAHLLYMAIQMQPTTALYLICERGEND